jgi:hypothetical protein
MTDPEARLRRLPNDCPAEAPAIPELAALAAPVKTPGRRTRTVSIGAATAALADDFDPFSGVLLELA